MDDTTQVELDEPGSPYLEIHLPSPTQLDSFSLDDVNSPLGTQTHLPAVNENQGLANNKNISLKIAVSDEKIDENITKEAAKISNKLEEVQAECLAYRSENEKLRQQVEQLKHLLKKEKKTKAKQEEANMSIPLPPASPRVSALVDYKSVFEAAPNPYLILCSDPPLFTCVGVTELYLKLTLKKREEVVGKGLFQVFPENPADDVSSSEGNLRLSLMRVIANKKLDMMPVQKYDVEDPNKPGVYISKYWTPINIPVWTKEGQMYILHRVEDVTEFMELKQQGQDAARAETLNHIKRVEESQARYHRLTALLPLGIFHTASSGELTYVNQSFERMARANWETISSEHKCWFEWLPGNQSNIGENWQAARHELFQVEYHTTAPEGWFMVHLVPELSKTSTIKGFLGYIIDVTERKLSEEAQRKRAEQLAELDRAKTVFFSNISHELRTPLTLILGPAEDSLLETGRQALPPRQRERMEVIQRSAQRLLKLVNSSLDFTRLEEGRLNSEFEPTDIGDFTDVLAKLFRPAMENVSLTFQIDIRPFTEPVYLDRDLWQKIVFNLLSNALKYTLKGGVTMLLKQQDGQACLVVQDTGIGIPAAELPNMFQRFHRVAGRDGRSHEGAGIGLSLTQQLVKLHGGTISVVSEVDKGSVFTVTIPLGSAHLPPHLVKDTPVGVTAPVGQSAQLFVKEALSWAGESTSGRLSPPQPEYLPVGTPPNKDLGSNERSISPSPPRGEQLKILVADDNPDMRKLLKNLLSAEFSVVTVEDGAAAWNAIKSEKFDLVVSDLMMPGMDGFQLIKALREDEKTQTLPVILLSARVDEESRLRGLHLGADDFVVKPFSRRELLERVGGRLRAGRWRHQLAQELLEFQDESQRQKRLLQLVSHELRNPLVGIKGNSEIVESLLESMETSLMQCDAKDQVLAKLAESRAAIRVVLQCTDYQKIICDDVLDMAKLKEQKMELHLSSFDPSQIVTDAVQMLSVRAQQGEIKLSAQCKMKRRIVVGDATRLTQVLVNLISNAIKFTQKQGSIVVALQSPSETAERIELEFSVEDNGMGMSEEQQAKIFSPFTQASSAIQSQFGGTGLGLSISKSLVELMGGQIVVTSALGKGSKFTATVYCGNVFLTATPPTPSKKLQQRKLQVLVVDDTVINQKILKRMLDTAGHQCAVANNGQEALNMWTQMVKVDAILMDLNMPVMGGLEATRCIRQAESQKLDCTPTWIIGLSGDNADAVAWREAGMNDYVVKPYNQRDLLEKITQGRAE